MWSARPFFCLLKPHYLANFIADPVCVCAVTHTELAKFTDGFTSMSYKYTGSPTITILPTPAGGCDGSLTGCELAKGSFDLDTMFEVSAVLPPAAELAVPAGAGVPTKIFIQQCFAPAAAVGRKWRNLNDPFEVRHPWTAH